MENVFHLFSQLSHLEQLQVMETLPGMIKVDFIGKLPLLAVERIISFLSVKDVVNSSKVSMKWHSIIMSSYKYWMGVCRVAGLSEGYVNGQVKYSSLVKFALKIHQHASKTERLLTVACHHNMVHIDSVLLGLGGSLIDYDLLWIILVKPGRHVWICSFGAPILYWEIHDKSYFGYIKNIPKSLPCQSKFEQSFKISWTAVYRNNLIVATNDAEWIRINDVNVTKRWIDSEVVSIHAQLCVCSNCGFVVQVSRDSKYSNMLNWIVQCVLLLDYENVTKRLACSFNLLDIDSNLKESDAIFLQSVAIFLQSVAIMPNTNATDTDTYPAVASRFCSSHLLFLQYNSSIMIQKVTSDFQHSLSVLPQRVLISNQAGSAQPPLLDLTNRRNKFRLSVTCNTLALIINSSLFVWNVQSKESPSLLQIDLTKATNPFGVGNYRYSNNRFQLIAVGDIHCILQCNISELITISVLTGRMVYKANLVHAHELRRDEELVVCCVRQDWLN